MNLSVGLVNGALGPVCKIAESGVDLREIHVEVDKGGEVQKLTRVTFESKRLFIHREQFPLAPSYAITAHKSQSLTLDVRLSYHVFRRRSLC